MTHGRAEKPRVDRAHAMDSWFFFSVYESSEQNMGVSVVAVPLGEAVAFIFLWRQLQDNHPADFFAFLEKIF